MFSIPVCRVCLDTGVQMFDILNTNLQDIYEKLTNTKLTNKDNMPHTACYMCFSRLKNCLKFKELSEQANQVLTQLKLDHLGVNIASVKRIDRQTHNFSILPPVCIELPEPKDEKNKISIKAEQYLDNDCYDEEYNVFSDVKGQESLNKVNTHDDKQESYNVTVKDLPQSNDENAQKSPFEVPIKLALSDSEDDLPLKSIVRIELQKRKNKVKVRKKGNINDSNIKLRKEFKTEYAREILLTKEEQIEALEQRAKSSNYQGSPYKCETCYKGFLKLQAYENHCVKHDKRSGAYECEICRMRYQSRQQLRAHVTGSHARLYACTQCGHRSLTANQARDHEKWHKGYTYQCQLCSQKFIKPTSYLTHMRKHHAVSHACPACGVSCLGARGLRLHRAKRHAHPHPVENTTEPASTRFCKACNVQFLSVEAWKRHILTSVNHQHLNDDSTCVICKENFGQLGKLRHMKKHLRELKPPRTPTPDTTPVSCDQCGANFDSQPKLQVHVKRKHLGVKYIKSIVCEVCGKKCTSNASLRYHQLRHTGERPHPCSFCPKRFADSNQLRIHMRTHTGERPYVCTRCPRTFSQRPALTRHQRVHTGVKPYTCTYCTKTFSQSNSLKLHIAGVHLKLPSNSRRKKASEKTKDTQKIEEESNSFPKSE